MHSLINFIKLIFGGYMEKSKCCSDTNNAQNQCSCELKKCCCCCSKDCDCGCHKKDK